MLNEFGEEIGVSDNEKGWAITVHICSFIGLILFILTLIYISLEILKYYHKTTNYDLTSLVYIIIPIVFNILIPFILFSTIKNMSLFLKDHCTECLNFQISFTIYFIISLATIPIIVGFILIVILLIFDVTSVVEAVKKAINGDTYRYPFSIHFFR